MGTTPPHKSWSSSHFGRYGREGVGPTTCCDLHEGLEGDGRPPAGVSTPTSQPLPCSGRRGTAARPPGPAFTHPLMQASCQNGFFGGNRFSGRKMTPLWPDPSGRDLFGAIHATPAWAVQEHRGANRPIDPGGVVNHSKSCHPPPRERRFGGLGANRLHGGEGLVPLRAAGARLAGRRFLRGTDGSATGVRRDRITVGRERSPPVQPAAESDEHIPRKTV